MLGSGLGLFAQEDPVTVKGEGDTSETSATVTSDGKVIFKVNGKAVGTEEDEDEEGREIPVSQLSEEDEAVQSDLRSSLEAEFMNLESRFSEDPGFASEAELLAIAEFLQTLPGFGPDFQRALAVAVERYSPTPPPPPPSFVDEEVDPVNPIPASEPTPEPPAPPPVPAPYDGQG